MNEEYLKGKEIGQLVAEIQALNDMIKTHVREQHDWNKTMETEVELLKTWVQTTTGKVVILTSIFGVVGSVCYIGVNYVITNFLSK
jgi:hypothetical protein